MIDTDRPATKADDSASEGIEITPEMIEAGLIHLYRYHPDRGMSDEESVKAIYRAMHRLRRETLRART